MPCHGDFYALRYESYYAALRRQLFANPNMALPTIAQELHGAQLNTRLEREYPERMRTSLGHGVWNPVPFDASRPGRHCVECSRRLWHFWCFDLPWLTHCPLHKIPLLDACSQCHQRWPSLNDLGERDCPLCGGLLDVCRQRPCFDQPQPADIAPISMLSECLIDSQQHEVSIQNTWPNYSYWLPTPITHPLFPTYAATWHPSLSQEVLRQLEIETVPTETLHFELIPEEQTSFLPPSNEVVERYTGHAKEKAARWVNDQLLQRGTSPALISNFEHHMRSALSGETSDVPDSPALVAYNFWVLSNFTPPYTSRKSLLAQRAAPGWELPSCPVPQYMVVDGEKRFAGDEAFREYTYYRDLQTHFLDLLKVSEHMLECMKRFAWLSPDRIQRIAECVHNGRLATESVTGTQVAYYFYRVDDSLLLLQPLDPH